ncbi:MAG: S8 family peptidase [Eubacterium sp.]
MNRINKMYDMGRIHAEGYMGRGVGVAVLDTGIFTHPDFDNRIILFKDFVNKRQKVYDDNGHGTHISGIIAGNGRSQNGRYMGIAPGCNIISIKVLDENGAGESEILIKAIDWVIRNRIIYNIRVMNISIGAVADDKYEESALVQAVNRAWDAGIVVVVAAGNNGPAYSSITTPGISRKVITVGASDDIKTVSINGKNSSEYSGRGPTKECIKKPDVVAPASEVVSCIPYESGNRFIKRMYGSKSGTSISTPIVSGAIALLIGINPLITNKSVKICIRDTSIDIGMPHSKQGWGLLDIRQLLEYGKNFPAGTSNIS